MAENTEKTQINERKELICEPALQDWGALAARQYDSWDDSLIIAGQPLTKVRSLARKEAGSYIARFGLNLNPAPPDFKTSQPLVVTVHRPAFIPAGTWIRNFMMTGVCGNGLSGLCCLLDSQPADDLSAIIPTGSGVPGHVVKLSLLEDTFDTPIEELEPPDTANWLTFHGKVEQTLRAQPGEPSPLEKQVELHRRTGEDLIGKTTGLGQFMSAIRRKMEARVNPPGYSEVTISALTDSLAFKLFLIDMADRITVFIEKFNECLDSFREEFRVSDPLLPVPNLQAGGRLYELPFWAFQNGEAPKPLFLALEQDNDWWLSIDREPVFKWSLDDPSIALVQLEKSGFRIRPWSIIDQLFLRLCLADVMLLGVGGAALAKIVDRLFLDFYCITVPPVITASAKLNIYPQQDSGDDEELSEMDRELREMTFHPELFINRLELDDIEALAAQDLYDQKIKLQTLIRATDEPSALHSAQLETVNKQLRDLIKPLMTTLMTERNDLISDLAKNEAGSHPAIPYFLFDPKTIHDLIE